MPMLSFNIRYWHSGHAKRHLATITTAVGPPQARARRLQQVVIVHEQHRGHLGQLVRSVPETAAGLA